MQRQGVLLQKSMTYRDGGISVFLVLPDNIDSVVWHGELLSFEGHDSNTAESSKHTDQVLQYAGGRLSDNGRFYKAAHSYKDGIDREPHQVQVYEKVNNGVWFDTGIFNLVDASYGKNDSGRKICTFVLEPADLALHPEKRTVWFERRLPTIDKQAAWQRSNGRCSVCGSAEDLHFSEEESMPAIVCGAHARYASAGLL